MNHYYYYDWSLPERDTHTAIRSEIFQFVFLACIFKLQIDYLSHNQRK